MLWHDTSTASPEKLLDGVRGYLADKLNQDRPARTFVFGCWLIRGHQAQPLQFGPVTFYSKEDWLERARADGHIPDVTQRRIVRAWTGAKLRPLKNSNARWKEQSVIDAIGSCPMVRVVQIDGLAKDVAYEKAVLSARLAMTAIALLWERPSEALDGFGLAIEGGPRTAQYVSFDQTGGMSSASNWSRRVGSTWIDNIEWASLCADIDWISRPVSELLTGLVQPPKVPVRPKVALSLLHALWWMYEGCRAEAPLMAAVKFGACLDVLAGGKSEGRILQLLKARLGAQPDDSITPDGRTARNVVKTIYGAARSQTLHGSNQRYDHDWRGVRDLAEHLTARCFVEVLNWLDQNPQASDLSGAVRDS